MLIAFALFQPARASAPVQVIDPRLDKLTIFFERYDCPIKKLAPEFIAAADANDLDWRLLPSIAFIESSGGKAYRNNNIFGWGSGNIVFRSIREGVHAVAAKLGRSELYRGKSVHQVLNTYNPVPGYSEKVQRVMARLGPEIPASFDTE